MTEIEFKKVELEHRALISGFFHKYCSRSCNLRGIEFFAAF